MTRPHLSLAVALGQRLRWSDAHAAQSWALMALAWVYLAAAAWLDGRGGPGQRNRTGWVVAGAGALYPMGYALSALATLLVAGDHPTLVWLFGLLLASWAWSAYWVATGRHRLFLRTIAALFPDRDGPPAEVALFGYLCAWLFPVWLLIASSPWLPGYNDGGFGLVLTVLAALYLTGARYLAQRAPMQARPWLSVGAILVALGPLLAVVGTTPRLVSTALALAACAVMARLTRRSEWVIEVALALPLLAYAIADVTMLDGIYYSLGFWPVAVLCLLAGNRLKAAGLGDAWSWPFNLVGYGGLCLLVVGMGMVVLVGMPYYALISASTAAAYSALLAIHALSGSRRIGQPEYWPSRRERLSAWLSVAYGSITLQSLLWLWHVNVSIHPACWAVIALGATAILPKLPRLWLRPLGWPATALACLCPAWAACLTGQPAGSGPQLFVITLAIAGLQVVTMGYQRRARRLVYGGVAVVLGAYLGQLFLAAVTQPQLFVLPVGVYLLGVAWAERRIAPRRSVGKLLEVTGLLLLLGTSLLQALDYATNGVPASGYDLVVLAEGLVLLWVGDTLRWKDTLTAGALALGADALLIVAQPLRAIDTWYALAVAGLAIIGFVIAVEKKRQGLATLFGQWRRVRETWD